MLIRKGSSEDIDRVIDLWIEASSASHDFVPPGYIRKEARGAFRHDLRFNKAEVYLHETDSSLDGFACLIGTAVRAIGVRPDRQGQGIGAALMKHVQSLRSELYLCVYTRNVSACRFYERRGFAVIDRYTCSETGCEEVQMHWKQVS